MVLRSAAPESAADTRAPRGRRKGSPAHGLAAGSKMGRRPNVRGLPDLPGVATCTRSSQKLAPSVPAQTLAPVGPLTAALAPVGPLTDRDRGDNARHCQRPAPSDSRPTRSWWTREHSDARACTAPALRPAGFPRPESPHRPASPGPTQGGDGGFGLRVRDPSRLPGLCCGGSTSPARRRPRWVPLERLRGGSLLSTE